jgi:hypothetical protein
MGRRSRELALTGLVTVCAIVLLAGAQVPSPQPRPPAQPGSAQPQVSTPQGSGVILGDVVDGKDGRPIAGAIVSLSGGAPAGVGGAGARGTPAPPPSPRRVMADSRGRFMFFALPAGSYVASASAPGYMTSLYGQTRANGPNKPIVLTYNDNKSGSVQILLWKFATISGTITDDAGEPAVGVNVRAMRRQSVGGSSRFVMSNATSTDDRGIYRIANLIPGDYVVLVPTSSSTMPVSVVQDYQQLISQRNTTAANEFNRRLTSSGAPPPSPNGARVGDFYLQQNSLSGSGLGPPVGPLSTDRPMIYSTVFFPAALTSTQATVMTLASGDERVGVDLQLRQVPSFRVSGTVTGPENQTSNLGVRLLPTNYNEYSADLGSETANTVTQADGSFTLLGVPAGSYVLKVLRVPLPQPSPEQLRLAQTNGVINLTAAFSGPEGSAGPVPQMLPTDPTLWGEVQISVMDADVTGVQLTLHTGPRVTGRIEFDGSAPKPALDRTPPQVSLSLNPVDGRMTGPIMPPAISANGQFTTMSMPPGRYTVSGGAPGWILKSVMAGGRDVSDLPIDLETDVSGVVVTFFDRPSQVSGTVKTSRGDADDSAWVLLVPDIRDAGVRSRRVRSARTSPQGSYNLVSILPGDYWIVAMKDNPLDAGYDQDQLLDAVSRAGTRLTIADAEHRTQDLTTSSSPLR